MKTVLAIALLVAMGLAISACGAAEPTGTSYSPDVSSGASFSNAAPAPPVPAEPDNSAETSAESERGGLMFGSGS
jgi:hypothetical protein